MFDGIERAQDLDELCSLFFSEKTDPPLPDSPYIIATLRSDQTAGLKPVLLQVCLSSPVSIVYSLPSLSTVCSMVCG